MLHALIKPYDRLRYWFLKDRFAENKNGIYHSRLKLAYSVYFFFALLGYAWITYLTTSPYKFLLVFSVFLAAVHTSLLFALKYFRALFISGIISVAASFAVINIQMYYSQGTVNFVTCSWLIILSLFVFFLYGRRAGLGLIVLSIFSIAIFSYLNIIGFQFPEFIIEERMFYVGVLISLVFVFLFTYLIVDRYMKYTQELFGRLNQSEIRLSTIVDNLPIAGVYVYNNLIFFNKKFEHLFGYDNKEITQFEQLIMKLFPLELEDYKMKFNEIINGKGKINNNIINAQTKSGEIKALEIFIQKSSNYEIFLFNDITDLKNKEQQLSESNYFIENISKALPHILYVFDVNVKKNVYINNYISSILGFTPDEFRSKFRKTYDAIYPDDVQRVFEHNMATYKLPDDEMLEVQYRMIHKNGSYVWLRSVDKVFKRNEDGSASLILGIAEDISKRKNAEQVKSDFLSVISHEIKTPLNAISGLVALLDKSGLNIEQAGYARLLKYSADNLNELFSDILDFNKLESGKDRLTLRPFNLSELMEKIYFSNHLFIGNKNIELTYVVDDRIPALVVGDDIKLKQAINNLVNNAVKYTESGTVEFRAELLNINPDSVLVKFIVKDTGTGISPELHKNIFDSFTRGKSKDKFYSGTGLGLSITKKIVDMFGSEIYLESDLGKGAVFYFSVSLLLKQNDEDLQLSSDLVFPKGKNKVLLVEDNEVNAFITNKLLLSWGADVTHVNDGNEALNIISKQRFHLVLLDLLMPTKDGYEVAESIRNSQDEQISNVPVITITASVLSEIAQRAFEAGINELIAKPIEPEELKDAIRRQLLR